VIGPFIFCIWLLAFSPPMDSVRSWAIVLLAWSCIVMAMNLSKVTPR